jgi:phage-related protein
MKQKKLGRKPIADKKQVLRIFIEQSIIDANGGETICKDECISFLKKRGQKKEKN